jgi:hypothetical protein
MFLNPPDSGFTIEESLLAGSRHTAVHTIDGVTTVTTIMVIQLDPAPPIYEVTRVAFREPHPGKRQYAGGSVVLAFDDLDEALKRMVEIHNQ